MERHCALMQIVWEGVGEGEVDGDGLPLGEGEPDGEGLPLGEALGEGEGLPLGEGEAEGEGEPDGDGDGVGVGDGRGQSALEAHWFAPVPGSEMQYDPLQAVCEKSMQSSSKVQ